MSFEKVPNIQLEIEFGLQRDVDLVNENIDSESKGTTTIEPFVRILRVRFKENTINDFISKRNAKKYFLGLYFLEIKLLFKLEQ